MWIIPQKYFVFMAINEAKMFLFIYKVYKKLIREEKWQPPKLKLNN